MQLRAFDLLVEAERLPPSIKLMSLTALLTSAYE